MASLRGVRRLDTLSLERPERLGGALLGSGNFRCKVSGV
jgi:hypothetical protein